jgi:hypothetical protein
MRALSISRVPRVLDTVLRGVCLGAACVYGQRSKCRLVFGGGENDCQFKYSTVWSSI